MKGFLKRRQAYSGAETALVISYAKEKNLEEICESGSTVAEDSPLGIDPKPMTTTAKIKYQFILKAFGL